MKGTINRFKNALGINAGKKIRKGKKKRSAEGSAFRDYRGVDGAVDDAEKGKK